MNKLCQISAMFQLCWAVDLIGTGRRAVIVMARGQEEVWEGTVHCRRFFLRLVGHERKEFDDGQFTCVQWYPELFCAGGEGRAVDFKSEPPLCYTVNEYFYLLIIQLPLDV